jgi:hypothetical protein
MSVFISFDQCRFEVYFVRDKYCYSCLFSGAIGLVNLLPAGERQFQGKDAIIGEVNSDVGTGGKSLCKSEVVGRCKEGERV